MCGIYGRFGNTVLGLCNNVLIRVKAARFSGVQLSPRYKATLRITDAVQWLGQSSPKSIRTKVSRPVWGCVHRPKHSRGRRCHPCMVQVVQQTSTCNSPPCTVPKSLQCKAINVYRLTGRWQEDFSLVYPGSWAAMR